MKPIGGSELLFNNLIKYTGQDWQNAVNLVLSFCNTTAIHPAKLNVIWQHLMHDQYAINGMYDANFVDKIDYFVYVSHWQKTQFETKFNLESANSRVIKNAIDPIDFLPKSDKIRLIYTSMPDRGLKILLDAFEIMNKQDVELVVYSSNIIYGTQYANSRTTVHDELFHRCKSNKNIQYKGYGTNKAVRKALQQSHILAYPSIYEETSCLAAIEAGAAGCKIVTTDYGALSETCDKWATYVPHTSNEQLLAENYAEILSNTIDNYDPNLYNIKNQSNWFNEKYSWTNRKIEWTNFFNQICEKY